MKLAAGDVRVTVGANVDAPSIAAANAALGTLGVSIKGVAGSSSGFSADVLALNPQLAALTGQASNAAAATQTLAQTQVLAANATAQNTAAIGAQKAGVQDLSALYAGLDANVKNVIRDIGDLGRAPIPEPRLGSIVPGLGETGGRSLGQNITRVGRGLFNAPDIGGVSTPLARGLIGGGAVVDAIGLSATALGGLAIVGVGLAIGMKALADEFNVAKEKAADYLAAQVKINTLVLGGATSEDLSKVRNDLVNQQKGQQQVIDKWREVIDAAQGAADEVQRQAQARGRSPFETPGLTEANTAFGSALDNLKELTGTNVIGVAASGLSELQKSADALTPQIISANAALQSGEVAANNMAEAEHRLREARSSAATQMYQELFQNIDQTVSTNLRLAELRRSGTKEEVDALLLSNQDKETILRNFAIPAAAATAATEEGKAKLEAYRNELNELIRTDELLIGSVKPIIEARERESAAIEAQLVVINDSIAYSQQLSEQIRTATVEQVSDRLHALQEENRAIQTFLPQLQELAPTSREAALALADAEMRLGRISDDYVDLVTRVLPAAIARGQQQLAADQADIRAKSQAKLSEIEANRLEADGKAKETRDDAYENAEQKRGDALNDLAEKQATDRAKIERKSNVDITTAIYGRNALAAFLALQQKKEDLTDLEERGRERGKELDKQYAKERQVADRNYANALDNARDAAAKSIRLEQQRTQVELDSKVTAYNAQLALLHAFNVSGTQSIAAFVNNGLNLLSQLSGASGGSLPSVISYPGLPPGVSLPPVTGTAARYYPDQIGRPYAAGGNATGMIRVNDGGGMESAYNYRSNQLVLLSSPMRVFSAPKTQRMLASGGNGNSLTINIPITGTQMRKRDIEHYVDGRLGEALDKAGYQ